MRKQTPDTEIVFQDLSFAYNSVHDNCENPTMVRRWFIIFVTLTQKLTDIMRKEYSAATALKWEAGTFPGWNPVTTFFKELRNTDQHQLPIRITLTQTQIYECYILEVDESGNEIEVPTRMHIQFGNSPEVGYEEIVPKQNAVEPLDKEGNPMESVEPVEIRYEYQVEGRTPKVEKLLSDIGITSLHILTTICYETLCSYYEFYIAQVEANRKKES